jgi:hypothetical protein
MKSVYIETSIVSYLAAKPSRDLRTAAWQQLTAQWWEQERRHYKLVSSRLVKIEASAGEENAAKRRLTLLQRTTEITITDEAKDLAKKLILRGGVPRAAEIDALHIAIACVHGIHYLLTWNCRHINNATTKPVIRHICETGGYTCPEICTPIELSVEGLRNV